MSKLIDLLFIVFAASMVALIVYGVVIYGTSDRRCPTESAANARCELAIMAGDRK